MRSDHHHLTAYQIGCEVGQSVGLVLRPAIFVANLAFDITSFFQALRGKRYGVCKGRANRCRETRSSASTAVALSPRASESPPRRRAA